MRRTRKPSWRGEVLVGGAARAGSTASMTHGSVSSGKALAEAWRQPSPWWPGTAAAPP
jgi:hypothetical protein